MPEPLTFPGSPHLQIPTWRWWTTAPPAGICLGAVVVYDTLMATVKVYLGRGQGLDEREDVLTIAQWGAKLDPVIGIAMFPAWADKEWAVDG
jgi:hypothetical protein